MCILFLRPLRVILTFLFLGPAIGFAAPLSVTPNDFQGSDIERINQAVRAAAAGNGNVIIPRVNEHPEGNRPLWLIDEAILLPANVTLELRNCHLKLSDQSRDNFIRSANCGLGITNITTLENIHIIGQGRVILEGADHPRASGDSAKQLGTRTYGTDAGKPDVSQTGDWRNIGILLAFVEDFSISNLHIVNSHCWAVSLERCGNGRVENLSFNSTEYRTIDGKREITRNQDGLDLRQGCHDIIIQNITGHTGDDLIALTNIENKTSVPGSTTSTMVSQANNRGDGRDDIRNIVIRNVVGHSAGGHHIVRFLNASGLKIHDVILDGLIDTSTTRRCKAAVKIGDRNPVWGGVTPLGDTYRFQISNVSSQAQHTLLIAGSLADSSISNITRHGAAGEVISYESGKANVRNVSTANLLNLTQPE